MASSEQLPANVTTFGPDATCHLHNCPTEWSLYGYRPSLAANITLIVIWAILGLVHSYLGWRWKSWGFMVGMLLGCLSEMIGYVGRIMLYYNPFSFNGFMLQIICLTIAPVFFTASIYVTLSKTIVYLAPDLSRFKPQLFYYIFIPADVVCLVLQAAGGAMSTNSGTSGDSNAGSSSDVGVDLSLAGLSMQIIVLAIFIAAYADYMVRFLRSAQTTKFDWRLKTFFVGLSLAIVLILARCAYRVAELKGGYRGSLFRDEATFIALEGVVVVLAASSLCFGHPGLVFDRQSTSSSAQSKVADSGESGLNTPHEK